MRFLRANTLPRIIKADLPLHVAIAAQKELKKHNVWWKLHMARKHIPTDKDRWPNWGSREYLELWNDYLTNYWAEVREKHYWATAKQKQSQQHKDNHAR